MMFQSSPQTLTEGHPRDASIVDQDVKREISLLECQDEVLGGLERAQVQLHVLQSDLLGWVLTHQLLLDALDGLKEEQSCSTKDTLSQ